MLKGLIAVAAIVGVLMFTGVIEVRVNPGQLAAIPTMAMNLASQVGVSETLMARLSSLPTTSPSPTAAVKGAQDTKPVPTEEPKATEKPTSTAIELKF